MILRARYIAPLNRPVIENGGLAIAGERIECVGTIAEVQRIASDAAVIDTGDVVLLPGFVNAHTHLELSHLRARVEPRPDSANPPLIDWLGRLMQTASAGDDVATVQQAVRDGLAESLAAGVTTIGDVTRSPNITRPILSRGPIRVVSYGEVIAIGNRRRLLEPRLAAAVDLAHVSDTLIVGLSPHAPYTVEPAGLRRSAECAANLGLPVCVHAAESREEEEFTRRAAGPFRAYLERLGVWDDDVPLSHMRPIELLDACGLLGAATLLAHANYANDADIDLIARRSAHVAFCPRTQAAFGHDPHPWRKMLARGVNVCIGTDSLASNPTLSILDELRFLHSAAPHAAPPDLFGMATWRGADALGLGLRLGQLNPGGLADLVAAPLDPTGNADPLANMLESDQQPSAVWIGGRRVL